MIDWASASRTLAVAGIAGVMVSGCLPIGQPSTKGQTRAYFQKAQERTQALDHEGAIRAYRKILQINPESARAHFELGVLCDDEIKKPAAAIYHYQNFKRLKPDSPKIEDFVQPSILQCKRELARGVSLKPVTRDMQQHLEAVSAKNKKLAETNQVLEKENQQLERTINRLEQKFARAQTQIQNLEDRRGEEATPRSGDSGSGRQPIASSGRRGGQSSSRVTYHTVKASETMYGIARHYGIDVEDIQTANPNVEPRRMTAGTKLKIPYP